MVSRRDWLLGTGAALAATGLQAQRPATRIGVELGCISANKWTPFQYLDYFKKTGIEAAQFNAGTLGVNYAAPDETALKQIRAYANNLGITLAAFSGSCVCPTSASFDAKRGTAEQQIAQGLKISRIIGASAMRVVLGNFKDRPEIARHLESLARTLKGMRGQIRDSGVKLAIENHNGDLQAREIKALIEEVGSDILGSCIDSGNPLWTLEDPHLTLELLGPYVAASHIRDTAVWRVPEGVAVRWVNMGEGNIGIGDWVKKFVALHPELPITFENLPAAEPRIIRVFEPETFRDFPKMPAADLSRYLALAERGKPVPAVPPTPGKSRGEQQCADLEVCVRYTRKLLAGA